MWENAWKKRGRGRKATAVNWAQENVVTHKGKEDFSSLFSSTLFTLQSEVNAINLILSPLCSGASLRGEDGRTDVQAGRDEE